MARSFEPRPVELLAPAKDLATGRAAILHGADAVYIGAPSFGARASAGVSIEDIGRLAYFARLYRAKVYVALNTILYDDELPEAERIAWELYRAGADALIVQDMSLCRLSLPPIALHASTQCDIRTVEKVRMFQSLGYEQVVLARELSLPEIRKIADSTSVVLEAFVHGALCVSLSGQCYLSEALTGRSANRGACAQLCRLPYTMIDADGKVIRSNQHLLSLKDLNRSAELESMLEAGISSFKIEGRLKGISYVKNVTAHYRRLLDELISRYPERYCRASSGRCSFVFHPAPEKSFNRGFTDLLLSGKRDTDSLITPESNKSRGAYIGRVTAVKRDKISIRLRSDNTESKTSLANGDGLYLLHPDGSMSGTRINVVLPDGSIQVDNPAGIVPGTNVFRNYDIRFEKALSQDNSAVRLIPVSLTLTDVPEGFSLLIEADGYPPAKGTIAAAHEPANRFDEEQIRKNLSKLGGTPLEAFSVNIRLSHDYFIPLSLIGQLRREAVQSFIETASAMPERKGNAVARHRKPPTADCPREGDQSLSFLANVANKEAEAFYRQMGYTAIAPTFEHSHPQGVPLMFSKHCLRYHLGYCPTFQHKKSPYREPYYLVHGDSRLRLEFDCRHCQMLVYLDKQIQ
ncbi:collagenase [Porphyromonas sp. COT-052 OH4946]|uniref:peptidase U32 family protein n=1 Tax=Porphyromonas sp. COT-052 OH4946 TaxID=1515618 RepID=UPI00051D6E75|nr:U32 family peptidase [Porphyromonas sp. COT-052 OH4946]KGL54954.1 collagenase [Porphyromonas sp. COT-052 OH4946]